MKRIIIAMVMCMPLIAFAQTDTITQDRVAALRVEAAVEAQKAADAAAAEAEKVSKQTNADALSENTYKDHTATLAEQTTKKETAGAQDVNWTAPVFVEDKAEKISKEKAASSVKETEKSIYLAEGAVPLIDGKVQWIYELDIPSKNARQIYDEMFQFLSKMTKEDNQLERSRIALVNEKEYKIAASLQEWLVFSSSFISLDRTKFNYMLYANCSDGHLQIILDRISYIYGEEKEPARYKAEKWITDEYSVNKKRTRLYPICGKFRRKTIDRKNEIFKEIKAAIL